MKFTLFNGPLEAFEKYVPNEDLNSLTRVVNAMDMFMKTQQLQIDSFKYLLVYSDEYTGVNEHFIEGFVNYILLYQEFLDFQQVYLHNPPKKISEQLKKHKECEVVKKQYSYKRLTEKRLKQIKEEFDSNVFGQEHVKTEILQSLYSLSNGGKNKPKILMLNGLPGVGKTETAKLVNQILNGNKLFRKQLSMFHSDNIYSYIFGDKVYSLSKDLIERETNVMLFDEFDKAHPLFYSAFYEMFDEGVFEDKYYRVPLDNAIILCTANYSTEKEMKEKLGTALFSRFDNIIPYKRLSQEAKIKILERAYEEELLKFKRDDREFIKSQNIMDKMKSTVTNFENAREIRNILNKVMSYPLVLKL